MEKKLTATRKLVDGVGKTRSNTLSEFQPSDNRKNNDRNQSSASSSSSTNKRKVLSLAEYVGSKQRKSSPTSTVNSTQNPLTDTQIKEIYANFDAKYEELAANAADLAQNVKNKLTQNDTKPNNRTSVITNNHNLNTSINETVKAKSNDIWEEEDDDDDDNANNNYSTQPIAKQTQPIKTNQTIEKKNLNTQQLKKSVSTTSSKSKNRSMEAAIATLEHSQPPSRPTQSQVVVQPKTTDSFNFLRPKQGRQAIYSGKRASRTNIPSLQDLCVEVLKDNVEDACRTHFCRLPYELVKPIIESATPDQLNMITDNNPDYVDDVEPLWKQYCSLNYKDAEREEGESYYELYWRKYNENEERLQRITKLAKRKKAETVETGRQTKPLAVRQTASRHVITNTSNKVIRQVVDLPPTKGVRGGKIAKVKKPTIPPLLKKTLKFYNGKF